MIDHATTSPLPFLDGWITRPLLEGGVLTAAQVREVATTGAPLLWTAAVERGWATDAAIVRTIAAAFRVPLADLRTADPRLTALLPEAAARKYRVVPLAADSGRITLATADPRDLHTEHELRFLTGRVVHFAVAAPSAIETRLDELYRPEASVERLLGGLAAVEVEAEVAPEPSPRSVRDPALEAPVAKLVGALLAEGVRQRASDVHFDPDEAGLAVRLRVDGVLREVLRLPASAGAAAVRRVKVLARLDVANPLVPHDGRATIRVDGKSVDLRVATAPVARHGEKAVVRILAGENLKTGLGDLGLARPELEAIAALLEHREGMVLVTGPTGSGKTTTLYAALRQLRTGKVNIITVEDPVEYDLPGVSQIQVSGSQGLDFASVLRSVLRQDPDIVLVGEIRDLETATTAVQAGLTGHLVLSTLHTNDAAAAVVRLRDLGLETFQLAGVLKGVIAQRLVRRLCDQCALPAGGVEIPAGCEPPAGRGLRIRRPVGCPACDGSGYRGRLAVQEILTVDERVGRLIGEDAPAITVAEAARKGGMRSLWESGLERVWDGLTTCDELVRVLGARTPPPRPAAMPTSVGALPENAPRILVADDDDQMRRLLRQVLEREGYTVAEARDGLDTLAQVDACVPALVLLDVDMPRLDGFGVLEELRTRVRTASLPGVMLTARAESEGEALDLGAQDFLSKPVRPDSLRSRVRAVLKRARPTQNP